jgi:hypothetical protein
MDDLLEDLYQEALAASRVKRWRRENSYVADLVETLWPHGALGLSRRMAIQSMERSRRAKRLPIPDSFEQTLQSAFNQHCVESAVFSKRNAPADGLFSSRRNGNTTSWIVRRDRATAWLIARNKAAEGTLMSPSTSS